MKGMTFRLIFFNKGLEHESGFFIATPCIISGDGISCTASAKETTATTTGLLINRNETAVVIQ